LELEFFFLCQNIIKGDGQMFSDEQLEKIFANEEVQKISIADLSTMINVIAKVLEEEDNNVNKL
jgi:hypothetical protein